MFSTTETEGITMCHLQTDLIGKRAICVTQDDRVVTIRALFVKDQVPSICIVEDIGGGLWDVYAKDLYLLENQPLAEHKVPTDDSTKPLPKGSDQ